jgi:hypothetical protein
MVVDLMLPAFTAVGSAGIAWYLARAQTQTVCLSAMTKLKASLQREKQRNKVLAAQLALAHAKLQCVTTLRSVELAALRACVPQDLIHQLDRSPLRTVSQNLDFEFDEQQVSLGAKASSGQRKRIGAAH